MSPDPAPSATSSAVPSHGTGLPLAGPLCPLSLPVTHKPSGAPHLLKMGSPHIYLALARAQHFLPSSSAQALSGPTSPLTVFMPPSPGACPDLSLFQFWRWISLAWVPRSHVSITTRDQGSAGSGDGGQETEARSHQARSIRSLFLVLKAGDPCWAFGKGDSSLTTLPPAGAWKGEKPGRPPHRVLWDPSSTSRLA